MTTKLFQCTCRYCGATFQRHTSKSTLCDNPECRKKAKAENDKKYANSEKGKATKRITESIVNDENITRYQVFERQQQLEALNRLQSLQSLQLSKGSFENVKIYKNSVVYCDIPYSNTNAYGKKNINSFDYKKFYKWCEQQEEFVIISEYQMPEDKFVCIGGIEKPVMLDSGADLKAVERLFIPKHQ